MQQTKRRSKKGLTLLALAIALLVVAIVPAAAMAAPSVLEPQLELGGVVGQSDYHWFGDGTTPVDGEYTPLFDGVEVDWTGILSINWVIDGDAVGHAFNIVHPAGPPQYVDFGDAGHPTEGLHTIESWLVQTSAANDPLISKPIVTDTFGIDSRDPHWDHVTIDEECFYNVPVEFSAVVSDPDGSGVATATASWDVGPGPPANVKSAWPLIWDEWIYEVTGTVEPPAHPFLPVTQLVELSATDMVGNVEDEYYEVSFDLVAPDTSFTVSPAGSNLQTGWTNQPVTVNFTAIDPDPQPNAGVDYTEYIVKTSDTTAEPTRPGIAESGTKGTSVVINQTAPIGPNYVYYRSVDAACPEGNKEEWNLVMVFFDNVAPALTNDYPGWWMNTDFGVDIDGSDHNSGIDTPGIEYKVSPFVAGHPTDWTVGGYKWFNLAFGSLSDGIFQLSYRATDKAGNFTEDMVELKVDTRAPVTDGADGWINGLEPYVLTATDQVPGAGVAATVYRVDMATPWQHNIADPVATQLETPITITGAHGSIHVIDFASVDDARPFLWVPEDVMHDGNWETAWMLPVTGPVAKDNGYELTPTIYKSLTVQLDTTAPEVTVTGNDDAWHKVPVTLNFAATDVGAGVDYIESSTDGGANWTMGDTATISENGEITVSYRAVDKVGIASATQTVVVKVATTRPSVKASNVAVKKGQKAKIKFNITAVTPTATSVVIELRTRSGRTLAKYRYANVPTNQNVTRSPRVKLKKGKYLIRVSAVDAAGNIQARRGTAMLTVK